MTPITEQRLRFNFGPSWQVVKYDDHPAYRKGIEQLKGPISCGNGHCPGPICCKGCGKEPAVGTRAVDIVGCQKGDLCLIEIKDFRRHEVENRKRLRDGDLALEVAFKVKDTLAGLVGAMHHRQHAPSLRDVIAPGFLRPPKVLLWLEEDMDPKRIQQRADPTLALRSALGKRLSWLCPHVTVLSRQTVRREHDLEVQSLSERVYGLRSLMKEQASLSRDDFCRVWSIPPQAAGEKLAQLCKQTILARAPGKEDRYAAGPRWDWWQDE